MKKFLEYLVSIPNVSSACERSGISRNTFYTWLKKYPEFKIEYDIAYLKGIDAMCDLCESKLLTQVNQGSFKAIKYYLDNNDPRYRKPRPRNIFDSVEDDGSISGITVTIDREEPDGSLTRTNM